MGDYYDDGVKQGVVFVVTPDGKHGKIVNLNDFSKLTWSEAKSACRNLGNGWRLPSKAELLMIYELKYKLNSVLIAVGNEFVDAWYWSADEDNSDCAWFVIMNNGLTLNRSKFNRIYVRAVSAF